MSGEDKQLWKQKATEQNNRVSCALSVAICLREFLRLYTWLCSVPTALCIVQLVSEMHQLQAQAPGVAGVPMLVPHLAQLMKQK